MFNSKLVWVIVFGSILLCCALAVIAAIGYMVVFSPASSNGVITAPAAVADSELNSTSLDLTNEVELTTPAMTYEQLEQEINGLSKYIGGYPPSFESEEERAAVYDKWLELKEAAEAHAAVTPDEEIGLYLLSELYRQGHNMDVPEAGQQAGRSLENCLLTYPESVKCHFSAMYFYLSVGGTHLDQAEESLQFLKAYFDPDLDAEVEAGYVFLYLYQQDAALAKRQIDFYVQNFPDDSRAEVFSKIKDSLGDTIPVREP